MQRTLQPELLDSLAPNDPDALHNRRDLRITNQVMGNHRWFARTLPSLLKSKASRETPEPLVLEIGAGTGDLAVLLNEKGIRVDGLDLWPQPESWPIECAWHSADLLTFSGYDAYVAVVGNLIFHQFDPSQLSALGKKLRSSCDVILACEPTRRRISQAIFRAVGPLLGANRVSLHDARVSIAAGFRDDELPRLLGLDEGEWDCHCSTTALGAYRMIAVRRPQ